jgi:hypothetical protein
MNNYLIYGLILLLISINSEKLQPQERVISATTEDGISSSITYFSDDLLFKDELYTIILRVDKKQNKTYQMDIQMNLKKGSYFVSPNEKENFSGKFTIIFSETEKLIASGTIIETPLSKGEPNNHGGLVHWVRQNTNYKQTLKVMSNKNFELNGYLQFTIEPRCTLEKIPFILSYTNGKLSVKMDRC